MSDPSPSRPPSDIDRILFDLRGVFVGLALISGVINLLALTGSLYMMQVYDRVLASRSVPTLVALTTVVVIAYAAQGTLEYLRTRILQRIGLHVDGLLGRRAYRAVLEIPLRLRSGGDGMMPLRDLDTIRTFLSSAGPGALVDLPWMPIFLIFTFLLSPWLSLLATLGALILIGLAVLSERITQEPARAAAGEHARRFSLAESTRRNTEALRAMGMSNRFVERWATMNETALARRSEADDRTAAIAALSRGLRYLLQSATLGLGAWLVIRGELAGGSIIAGSIATTRALAPIDAAIANWKNLTAARQARDRLDLAFRGLPETPPPMPLPPPVAELALDHVWAGPPRSPPIVQDVTLTLRAGDGLGIIGPSSAGKSSLARAMVGVWQPSRGSVRLDGAALDQWDFEALGRHIGFLPQDCELFDGTVAQNIGRFDETATPEETVAAARAAGVHELVLALPQGYDTRIGESGSMLSAGQRQRIGLARALFRDPFLIVLDEPNSNLDADGDAALTRAIRAVRERRGIVVVVAHRPSAIAAVDRVAVMANGRLQAFGPKDEVLNKATIQAPAPAPAAAAPAPRSPAPPRPLAAPARPTPDGRKH